MSPTLVDSAGRPITLGRELASGGEGVVYTLRGDDAQVAKIYRTPPSPATIDKLCWMVEHSSPKLTAIAAWPTSLLLDGSNVVGFLMPNLAGYEPIHHLYNPAQRFRYFPRATWAFLVHVARNLASAFDELHQLGVVVGDVNETNVRVSGAGLVKLIDCDSFQVTAGSHLYPCEVGVAHYTPPELQGQSFIGLARTPTHDRFGLAVLLFQLLFVGRHPYAGVVATEGDISIERSIAEYRFAYSTPATTPPFTLTLDDLSPVLAGMFRRGFERDSAARPSAGEWLLGLISLARKLTTCPTSDGHDHWHGVGACPWCRIVGERGPDYFHSADDPAFAFLPDEGRQREFLRRLQAVGVSEPPYTRETATPTHLAPARVIPRRNDTLLRWGRKLLALSTLGLAVSWPWLHPRAILNCLIVFATCAVALLLLLGLSPWCREYRRRRRAADRAERGLRERERSHAESLGRDHQRYHDRTQRVRLLLARCRSLGPEYQRTVADHADDYPALALRYRKEQQALFTEVAFLLDDLESFTPANRAALAAALQDLRHRVHVWAQADLDFRFIQWT